MLSASGGGFMKRRHLLALLGGTAAASAVLHPHAQQPVRRHRLGVLVYSSPDRDPNVQLFVNALRELGHVEKQNVEIEYRFGEGKPERLDGLAAELVQLKPDVIFATGGEVTSSVAAATRTI